MSRKGKPTLIPLRKLCANTSRFYSRSRRCWASLSPDSRGRRRPSNSVQGRVQLRAQLFICPNVPHQPTIRTFPGRRLTASTPTSTSSTSAPCRGGAHGKWGSRGVDAWGHCIFAAARGAAETVAVTLPSLTLAGFATALVAE